MKVEKLREEVLDKMKIGDRYIYLTDKLGMKCARQLIYNRQFRYPGCRIDTHESFRISNAGGMLRVLFIERVAFGVGEANVGKRRIRNKTSKNGAEESVEL